VFFDEAPVGKIEDQRPIERVELPVKRVERSLVTKSSRFDAPLDEAVAASLQFVVHEQADKVDRSEAALRR
jgi:hypothetical protein